MSQRPRGRGQEHVSLLLSAYSGGFYPTGGDDDSTVSNTVTHDPNDHDTSPRESQPKASSEDAPRRGAVAGAPAAEPPLESDLDLSDDLLEDGHLSSDDPSTDDLSSDDTDDPIDDELDLSDDLTELSADVEPEFEHGHFEAAPAAGSASGDDEEELDPFSGPATLDSMPEMPLINPFAYPVTPKARDEQAHVDLAGSDDPASFDGAAAAGAAEHHQEPAPVSLDPDEPEDVVARLRHEATKAEKKRRIDDLLSILDQLLRLVPDDESIVVKYEAALTDVIQDYFPGATPDSIPRLTVEAWELPDLVRDPVLGAILGRMDGITPLRDLYTALPDQEPGTVYRLVSRAKGKGLIRFDPSE